MPRRFDERPRTPPSQGHELGPPWDPKLYYAADMVELSSFRPVPDRGQEAYAVVCEGRRTPTRKAMRQELEREGWKVIRRLPVDGCRTCAGCVLWRLQAAEVTR